MNAQEFMLAYKPVIKQHVLSDGSGFSYQDNRPCARCADGFSVSIQASHTHYCTPREDGLSYYTMVELGYPSQADPIIAEYAEDPNNPTDTVYGYVPISVVDKLVMAHGGIVGPNKED